MLSLNSENKEEKSGVQSDAFYKKHSSHSMHPHKREEKRKKRRCWQKRKRKKTEINVFRTYRYSLLWNYIFVDRLRNVCNIDLYNIPHKLKHEIEFFDLHTLYIHTYTQRKTTH